MTTNNSKKVVTRFAPSPTGFLHIGGVRTALFAYLWARKKSGTFILRIEDTDKSREVAGSMAHIEECLHWLGLHWDFGPDTPGPFGSCLQSERLAVYHSYAQKLADAGLAYPDPYTEDEVAAFRSVAEANKKPFLYRNHRPTTLGVWDGKSALRLKTPEIKRYRWHDMVRGDLEAGEEALDDFVLVKADGYPTYNFAHIVDDHEMGVTHVIRGEEFISSTPRFLSLYDALGLPPPAFATMPPIQNDEKTKKLSKRDGAKDILEYRADGYLPEAMVNFLALIGWNPGGEQEVYTLEELVAHFDLVKVQKSGGAFNEDKLLWMNKEHIKKLSRDSAEENVLAYLPENLRAQAVADRTRFKKIVPTITERISTFGEIRTLAEAGEFDYFFSAPTVTREQLKTTEFLPQVIQTVEGMDVNAFTTENLKQALWDFATEKGRGNVLWPMRYALTGKEKSPDPFTIASLLGKDETLRRLHHAANL